MTKGRQQLPNPAETAGQGILNHSMPSSRAATKERSVATAVAVVEPDNTAETPEAPEPKRSGGKRRLIVLAAPVVLVGIGAGLWFSGLAPRLLGLQHQDASAEQARPVPIYVDLPELITNLNGNPQRPNYVKVTARLEVTKQEDVERVKAAMPRLQDLFLTYMREMRPQELRGSTGTYHLREELIARANLAAAPARVTDVLFTQMLVQ
jgi:flagellar FliL protein